MAVSFVDRLNRLDRRVLKNAGAPREGESRRDFLDRKTRGFLFYENAYLYREVIELHDRVEALEARLAALEKPA